MAHRFNVSTYYVTPEHLEKMREFSGTIKELQAEGYILDAQEISGKRKMINIHLKINQDKLRHN